MKTTMGIASAALVCAAATPAFAQDTDVVTAPPGAPRNALEIGVDTGYTQGFGLVSPGRRVGSVAGAGLSGGLSLGYRIDPRWSVALRGETQMYSAHGALARGTTVRGGAAGLGATVHLLPYQRVDPWVSFGAGYRAIQESPPGSAPSTITHGFELGRVQLGLDMRASESVAISPVIGADVNMFMWKSGGGAETSQLDQRSFNTFVFAGVQGRFDIGGSRSLKVTEQVGRR